MKLITTSIMQTFKFGKKIGSKLKPGDIIGLTGELGAGKTILTKGIARAIGIKDIITSPTFTIINEYKGKYKLFHFDLYRINTITELENLGYEEYFYNNGITVIEWAEKVLKILPEYSKIITIKILSERKREITYENLGF